MYYKLTYKSPDTTFAEEVQTNQKDVQERAWGIIAEKGKQGDVIIERRHSEYFGDFEHYLTVGFVKDPTQS